MFSKLFLMLMIIVVPLTVGSAYAVPSDIHLNGGINFQGTIFHRGDTVKFYGWSNANQDWKAGIIQVSGALFDVNITGPDGKIVLQKNFTADKNGSISFSLPITNELPFGKYVLNYTLSKEGYGDVHQFGGPNEFFASRQKSDIVEAKGYDFKLLPDSSYLKYQSFTTLHFGICPSPNTDNNEGFADPETGLTVDPFYGLVTYYFTEPNGTQISHDIYGGTMFNWFGASTCPTAGSESNFVANIGGNWTAYAVAKWVSNGTMYETKSDTVTIHVTEPQFTANITKVVNSATYVASGLDISQDKKFIVFVTGTTENERDVNLLWTVHPDGTGLQKIETGKEFQYISSTKISPSENFVLWSGSYYNDTGSPVYGLFAYDLQENKLVQISNGDGSQDSIGEYHWTSDNKIAYIAKYWDSNFHTLTTSLVISYPNGTEIKTDSADELSSLDLYRDPDKLGQMTVSVESYQDSGGGAVSIKSSDGFEEKIFEKVAGSTDPTGAAISSDGNTIVFSTNEGVYVAALDKSVLEYKTISQTTLTNGTSTTTQPTQNATVQQQTQSGIKFTNPTNLSLDGNSQDPQIAASGDNAYVVWQDWSKKPSQIYFKKSSDGGATFGNAVNLSNTDGTAFDPKIATYGNNIYISWTEQSQSRRSYQNVIFTKSSDGGATFSTPVNLSQKTDFTSVTANYESRIAVSGDNVYVMWRVSNYNWSNIFLSRSSDNGNTFDNPVDLSNADGTTIAQSPSIAASGPNVYVVWQAFDQSRNPHSGIIGLVRSSDNGVSFNVKNLTNGGVSWDPRIYAEGDTVYTFWREDNLGPWSGTVMFAKSLDGGMTFNVTKAGNGGLFADPSSTWVGTGGSPFISFTNGTDVFLIKSHDGGARFSKPIDLSNNAWGPDPYDDRPVPQIDVAGHNVFVAWRYTVSPEGKHAPFIAASTDGGDTFSRPADLSNSAGDTSGIPSMAVSGNHVYVVYTDTIPSASDVFFVSGTSNQTISDESHQITENNLPQSDNIFEKIFDWLKQTFRWS